jgi:hypothetical protein
VCCIGFIARVVPKMERWRSTKIRARSYLGCCAALLAHLRRQNRPAQEANKSNQRRPCLFSLVYF